MLYLIQVLLTVLMIISLMYAIGSLVLLVLGERHYYFSKVWYSLFDVEKV